MEIATVQDRVQEIFRDVLDDDELLITTGTTAENVEDWDSLTHIQLVVAIEKSFSIRFSASEIESYNNVGEMCHGIIEKLD